MPFSQIAVHQAIEQTVNHNTKTKGGISFSQRPGEVQQWLVNAHQRGEIARNCLTMAGIDEPSKPVNKEGKAAHIMKDEEAVRRVLSVLLVWKNPFATADEATSNISSGVVAPPAMLEDMLNAYAKGEQHFIQFVQDCLLSNTVPFHDVLPALKLGTFTTLMKATSVKVKGREVIVKADPQLLCSYARCHTELVNGLEASIPLLPWTSTPVASNR